MFVGLINMSPPYLLLYCYLVLDHIELAGDQYKEPS